jgi:hypothetical protein
MWDDSTQVTTECLNRPCLVAVVLTPSPPISEQIVNQDLVPNAYIAVVPDVRSYRRHKILQCQDGVGGGFRFGELALLIEPVEAI